MIRSEKNTALYLAAAAVSFSAIAYELVLATYATFLLGSTVFQYSLVFSVMMAAMGVGSYLSGTHTFNFHKAFVIAEVLLSVLAMLSIPVLYYLFSIQRGTQFALVALVILFGLLIGVEIPLLNDIKTKEGTVSKLLFSDYMGGFAGGLLFPLVLLPNLGFFRVTALLALLNVSVALYFIYVFRLQIKADFLKLKLLLTLLGLSSIVYFLTGETLRHYLESSFFGIGT